MILNPQLSWYIFSPAVGSSNGHKYGVRAFLINLGHSDPDTTSVRWAVVDTLTNTIPLITYSFILAQKLAKEINLSRKI